MQTSPVDQPHQTHNHQNRPNFAGCSPTAALSAEILAAPQPANPQEALKRLYAGNARFAQGESLAINRDLKRIQAIAERQSPFAAFLGCADSRVPVEIIFDQGFGDLFVTRIAGNIASSENIGSLEFAVAVLGVKALYVLGHTACALVAAAMKGTEVPRADQRAVSVHPASRQGGRGIPRRAVRENVRNQALVLAESSPVIVACCNGGSRDRRWSLRPADRARGTGGRQFIMNADHSSATTTTRNPMMLSPFRGSSLPRTGIRQRCTVQPVPATRDVPQSRTRTGRIFDRTGLIRVLVEEIGTPFGNISRHVVQPERISVCNCRLAMFPPGPALSRIAVGMISVEILLLRRKRIAVGKYRLRTRANTHIPIRLPSAGDIFFARSARPAMRTGDGRSRRRPATSRFPRATSGL